MGAYTNLVFKGGGVKGVAYAGALLQLEEMNILSQFKRFAGTSAGAITAVLLAVGYTAKEIEQIVAHEMDFESFMDKSRFPGKNITRLLRKFGWYKGDAFKDWISEKIKTKTGSKLTSFSDLNQLIKREPENFKELYVIATNLNRQSPTIFSVKENVNTPIADAVRMSMSIPLFFESIKWNSNIMVDGGMGYNYAIDLFDSDEYISDPKNLVKEKLGNGEVRINNETLGLWLDTKPGIDNLRNQAPKIPIVIDSFKSYALSLVDYLMEMANMAHLEDYDWDRSILIDSLDVKATDFKKVKKDVNELVDSGKQSVTVYFKKVAAKARAKKKTSVTD